MCPNRTISRGASGPPLVVVKSNTRRQLNIQGPSKGLLKRVKSSVPVLSIYMRHLDVCPQFFGLRLTIGEHLHYIDRSGIG